MKITLCIPLYNEEKILPDTVAQCKEFMSRYGDEGELLFIDDGSKDETLEILKKKAQEDNRVKYISFSRNFGKEAAMYAGF